MSKNLKLSTNKVLLGVCGGVAEYFNLDPTLVRVIWVILTLLGTIGIWLYLICYIVMYLSNK